MPDFVVEFGKIGRPPEPDGRLDAPAFHRNHAPIWSVLARYLESASGDALEIGSGTGQHVVTFAACNPALTWWPSDVNERHVQSIDAWRRHTGVGNVRPPLRIDISDAGWRRRCPGLPQRLCAIVCINVLHIAPWRVCEALMHTAGRDLAPGAHLFVYGPFMRDGQHTASSNAAFDASLRRENAEWGVRDIAALASLASREGLSFAAAVEMPANNQVLIFQHPA